MVILWKPAPFNSVFPIIQSEIPVNFSSFAINSLLFKNVNNSLISLGKLLKLSYAYLYCVFLFGGSLLLSQFSNFKDSKGFY